MVCKQILFCVILAHKVDLIDNKVALAVRDWGWQVLPILKKKINITLRRNGSHYSSKNMSPLHTDLLIGLRDQRVPQVVGL